MGTESSDGDGGDGDGEAPGSPPARRWIRVVDRMLWGVDVPASKAERSRRWKAMRTDVLSATKWLGRFFG